MANKVEIATALLGNYCGDLRRVGFSQQDIVTALKNGIRGLEKLGEVGESNFVNEVEAMLNGMGFKKVDEGEVGFDVFGKPQCNCPVCTARRARGAEHQDERNDV